MPNWMWRKIFRATGPRWVPRWAWACLFWFTWVGRAYSGESNGRVWRFSPAHAWELAWLEAGWKRE